jgi:hypothetical protein
VVRRPPLGAARLNIVQTATPLAADIKADMWWRQLDLPVRRRQITAEEGSIFAAPARPEANDQQAWYRPLGEPQRIKRSLYAQLTSSYAYFLPVVAETITIDKWYRPLDLPMRERRRITDQQELAAPVVTPEAFPGNATIAFASDSGMVVNRTIIYEDTAYAYFPTAVVGETITADKWWQQLVIPVRRRTIIEGAYSAAPPTPQANDQTAWHRPLEVPRRRKVVIEGAYSAAPAKPEANDQVAWYRVLDWPTRRKVVVEGAYSAAPPKPEANDQIGWYRPLEAPWRPKRLPQGAIPPEARSPFPIVPWGWYADLDKPVRLIKTPNQIGYTFVAAAPSDAVTQNWFLPLDLPVRARKLNEYPATAIPVYFVPATPGPGNELNWWPPLNEPVRPRITIRTAQQQGLTVPPRLLTTTLENSWFMQLNEPMRLKVTFGKYPQTAQGNINPIVPLAWSSIDEPRRLRGKYNYPALAQANINPIVPLAWQPLHAPHRLKGRIDYPAFAYGSYYPGLVAEVVTIDKWWAELHRPVRRTPSVANIQSITDTPSPRVVPVTFAYSFITTSAQIVTKTIIYEDRCDPPYAFTIIGGPADESERVACVPSSSRVVVEPGLLRTATVPLEDRVAVVPELLRVVDVPDTTRIVMSNDFRDRPCHDT